MSNLKEKCGVFAISGEPLSLNNLFKTLEKIQHRGRESFGISFVDKTNLINYCYQGLIKDNLKNNSEINNTTSLALLHTRYSTSGCKNKKSIQEDCMPKKCTNKYLNIDFSFAFNGNIPNDKKYKDFECLKNFNFEEYQDTNLIKHFMENYESNNIENLIIEFVRLFDRSFSLIIITHEALYFAKDKYGVKPLSIGQKGSWYMLSSESCAFPDD